METHPDGRFLAHDQKDLDTFILIWLYNKERQFPQADANFFHTAVCIAKHLEILPPR